MKKGIRIIVLLSLVLFAVSCTTFKFEGAQVTREIPSYNTVGTFDISVKVHEFLGASGGSNLFNVTADKMNTIIYDAIQREIQKYTGDAAVNISIEYEANFIDLLLNGITYGIYAPATAHIKGTIVKYNK
ncbi:Bor/Iss family lipoprotein [Gracilinema caldarium]|uniref:Lipoprotein n=1 Tax=Gracilinema caldarium (strain ATCC 51460 / DSM 7334 / H1) TaxID=744872 RepID=F8F3K2_GRAC1|nr:hypothetical protein [Gracilinema caldarium]AEJ19946.1 hypothetical protein Spica_1808 [Gracilinema caldarium DSM 7334]